MQWLSWAFVIAVAGETVTRLWLGSRQIAAVEAHRNEIPEPFRGQVALEDQQKASDYTAARVRLGRVATLVEALVRISLT
jgi:STE24 endopeptidase